MTIRLLVQWNRRGEDFPQGGFEWCSEFGGFGEGVEQRARAKLFLAREQRIAAYDFMRRSEQTRGDAVGVVEFTIR